MSTTYSRERAQCAAELWAILASHEGEDADAQLVIERALTEYSGRQGHALAAVITANEALGEIKDGLTYYERSPTKDPECFARWKQLNDTLVEAKRFLPS